MEIFRLDLEAILLDFAYLRLECYTSRTLFIRYPGTSVPPRIRKASDAFGDHPPTRALRAAQAGCGVSEDGPDMILFLKHGLGPDEQLTT